MTAPARATSPTTALLIAGLACGALACAWQAVRANGMAAVERQAREREAALREEAESQAREAEARDLETQMILVFVQKEVLAAKKWPTGAPQPNITLREALDRAEPVIAEGYSAQPLHEAAIRSALSVSYQQLQNFDAAIWQLQKALELRRQALGPTHAAIRAFVATKARRLTQKSPVNRRDNQVSSSQPGDACFSGPSPTRQKRFSGWFSVGGRDLMMSSPADAERSRGAKGIAIRFPCPEHVGISPQSRRLRSSAGMWPGRNP